MMDKLNIVAKPWAIMLTALESIIVSVAVIEAIDIGARVIAALAAVVIAYYTVRRLKNEMSLCDIRKKKEQLEVDIKQKQLENVIKSKYNIKHEPNTTSQ